MDDSSEKKLQILADAISDSVSESIAGAANEKVGIMFSGGLDSTVLACAAKKSCTPILFTCGTMNSDDLGTARNVAKELRLRLIEKTLGKEEITEVAREFEKTFGNDLLAIELACATSVLCGMARENGVKFLLAGSGAEELFAGYHRHVEHYKSGKNLAELLESEFASLPQRDIARAEKIAESFGIRIICPLMHEKVAKAARAFPPEMNISISKSGGITKKIILRQAARLLGVPESARLRPKKAMQYGSGVHKILMAQREKFAPGSRNPFKQPHKKASQ